METSGAGSVVGDPAYSRDERDRLPDTEMEADIIGNILGHQNVQVAKCRQPSFDAFCDP